MLISNVIPTCLVEERVELVAPDVSQPVRWDDVSGIVARVNPLGPLGRSNPRKVRVCRQLVFLHFVRTRQNVAFGRLLARSGSPLYNMI